MAGNHLIDEYLRSLQGHMRWRLDAADIDVELRDHLYSAAERLVETGSDPDEAQRIVLARFGATTDVAMSFASSGKRGPAVPTAFTKVAGMLGILAAIAWLGVLATWTVSVIIESLTGDWGFFETIPFVLGSTLLWSAAGLTTVFLVALDRRHGGLGAVGYLGVGLAGLGVLASLASWFIYGWGLLIGLGSMLVAVAISRRGMAPRLPSLVFGGGWLVAAFVGTGLQVFEVGTVDEWGDYPAALRSMVAIGCISFAAGLFGLGRWLHREESVDLDTFRDSAIA